MEWIIDVGWFWRRVIGVTTANYAAREFDSTFVSFFLEHMCVNECVFKELKVQIFLICGEFYNISIPEIFV